MMKKIISKIKYLPLFLLPALTFADKLTGKVGVRDIKGDTFPNLVNHVTNIFLSAAGLLAMLFLIWGGLQMVTSAGNPQRVGAAKKTLTNALIGLLLVIFSYTIFKVITGSFAAQLLK